MSSRGGVATGALVVLALTGCVAVAPAGPTEADVAAYERATLENSWRNTGLAGEAPLVDARPARPAMETTEPTMQCFEQSGLSVGSWGYNGVAGYSLEVVSGSTSPTPEDQRAFYICTASNPVEIDADAVLSAAQLDFIYDYQQSWLVPCMLLNGYGIASVMTRDEFVAIQGQWSPYFEAGIETSAEYDRAVQLCGPDRPALD